MTKVPDDVSPAERIDEICDRFEQDWRAGKRPQIEGLIGEAPEPLRCGLLRALAGLEVELRQQRGEQPSPAEYAARFPEHAAAVCEALADLGTIDSSVKASIAETARSPGGARRREATVLASLGRFQLLAVLGEGAFGTVYKAHDPQLDRHVAIKVPRSGALPTEDDRQRFLRDARASAALQHPAICPVHETGTAEGRDYIVMAFIDGKPLSKVVQASKRLPERQIVAAVRKIALALQEAHDKGIVHRDLKPANIMVNRKGEPVVMDFGLARRSQAGDSQISRSGQIMGTPAYMSPEQARGDGKAVGPAADIYSLGAIFYELLCGRRPFEGTITEVIGKILHVEVEPPSRHRPDVDPRLEAICLKAVAKQPADRFSSMKEFAAALTDYLKSAAAASGAASPAADPAKDAGATQQLADLVAAVSSDLEAKVERAAARAVRSQPLWGVPWWAYLIGASLAAMALGGIFFVVRKDTVTVIVNIPDIDPKDPTLTFVLDDKPVPAEMFLAPIELRPGEHELLVHKNQQLFKRFVFNVGKADRQPVLVQDRSPTDGAPQRAIVPFTAEEARRHQEAWGEYLHQPVEFENSVGMKLRLIPPGSFQMGSSREEVDQLVELARHDWEKWPIRTESPARRCELSAPFYLADCELHVAAFRAFVQATGYKTEAEANGQGGRRDGQGGKAEQRPELTWQLSEYAASDRHPVVQVTSRDAEAFCAWLSKQEGRQYFIPHEAQWEFACRAGTTTRWWNGDDSKDLPQIAWTAANTFRINAVGLKPANPFGLHDMSSNVQEICYSEGGRVTRGGRLWESPVMCRSASRSPLYGDGAWVYTGVRIAAWAQGDRASQEPPHFVDGDAGIAPRTAEQAKDFQVACGWQLSLPVEMTNSLGMPLRLIPPGTFRQGLSDPELEALLAFEPALTREGLRGERPAHRVRLTKPFYLGKYEVTVGQFRAFADATGYVTQGEKAARRQRNSAPSTWRQVPWVQTDQHPVVNVTWNDAREFFRWLSQKENREYRLPTSAEWEYACRAGTATLWYSGNDLESVVKIANVADATAKAKLASDWPDQMYLRVSDGYVESAPVGSFRANAFGLYDTIGNVWEWCDDWHADNPYAGLADRTVTDPASPASGSARVRRGGSWIHGIRFGHAATFSAGDPQQVYTVNYGFRVALTVDAAAPPAASAGD